MPYKDKAKHLEFHRIWQANKRVKIPTFNMFNLAKMRAKKKGIPFDLKLEDLELPEICPVLGINIYFGGKRNNTPSLDRVNPLKGYTKDNVCIISNKANALKNNASLEDLEKLVAYVKSFNARCN